MSISGLRRWPLIGGIVAILLLAGFAVFYLTRHSGTTPADFARYFPAREATVFYIDIGAIRASGLLDKLVGSTVGEDPEYRKFIEQTGFDYKRDLNQVMLNSAGGIHYFVLQGRFDWQKLESYAANQSGTCRDGYCYMKGSTPDRVISWRRIRRDMMALASARDEAGARAIDRRSDDPVTFQIPKASLWLYLPSEALHSASQLPAGTRMIAKALEPAQRAVFSLAANEDHFQLVMDVVCGSQEEAAIMKAQLESITKLLTSLIRRETKKPNPDDLSGVLTSGSFSRSETHVIGNWTIRRAFLLSLGSS